MNITLISAALAFAIGFGSAWSWQGSNKDAALLEQLQAAQDSIDAEIEKNKQLRDLRDEKYQTQRKLELSNRQRDAAHEETVTEIREVYITQDANATDCGLSASGVRVWNSAANGSGLPETESARPGVDGSAIVARNSEITRAATVSFKRHWAAIRQVEELQGYIMAECLPVAAK
jgi:hypothetical protein